MRWTNLVFGDEPTDEQTKSTASAPEATCLSLFAIHTAVGGTEIEPKRLIHTTAKPEFTRCRCVRVCVFGHHYTLYCKYSLNSRFMTMDTDARAGLKMSLLVASQVNSAPSSDLKRSETATEEVTVLPEKTSDEEGRSRPLRSHNTDGRGRPDKNNLQKLANAF